MKKIYLIILLLISSKNFTQTGNVGINTTTPHSSSVLELNSDTKGFLPPRLSTLAISNLSSSAAAGLIVFDKEKKQFLGWDGSKWQILGNNVSNTNVSFAAWEVNGLTNYGNSPFGATALNSSLTSASLERGSGLTTSGTAATNTWGATGFNQTTLANAVANNDYFQITLNFTAGKTVSFTKINAMNIRTTLTGSSEVRWQYSIDGVNFINIGNSNLLTNQNNTGNNISDIDLTVYYDLQDIDTNTVPSVRFRMVGYGVLASGGNTYINNISGNDLEFIGVIQ